MAPEGGAIRQRALHLRFLIANILQQFFHTDASFAEAIVEHRAVELIQTAIARNLGSTSIYLGEVLFEECPIVQLLQNLFPRFSLEPHFTICPDFFGTINANFTCFFIIFSFNS